MHDQIGQVRVEIGSLRKEMHEGFAAINRRLDQTIQIQLDEHATRIKKLETVGFCKITFTPDEHHDNRRNAQFTNVTSNTSTTPPSITINGENPAHIQVGDIYSDLGATIIGPQADQAKAP
jgi:hypothetical protein